MNIIYLKNVNTIEELKKLYKKLAFQLHPDITGDNGENMKQLNNEYDHLYPIIGKANGKTYKPSSVKENNYNSYDDEFKEMIEKLIRLHMENVTIEICGWFIYITGETKQYKDQLGKNGLQLKWNNQKTAWIYMPSWYKGFKHESWDMDKIRNVYGSSVVNNRQEQNDLVYA
jgi:curved DNA-binding protein CbpA